MNSESNSSLTTRREFLRDAFGGFGALAWMALLHEEKLRASGPNPSASKPGQRPEAKAG